MKKKNRGLESAEYLLLIVSYILIMFIFVVETTYYELTISGLTFFAIAQLLLSVMILRKKGQSIFSLASLFLIFSFVFHLSHLILITFNIDTIHAFDIRGFTNYDTYIKAIVFCIKVQMYVFIGIILSSGNIKKSKMYLENDKNNYNEEIDLKIVFYIGLTLFLIGLLPKLYIIINIIILYIKGNYLATYDLSLSGIIVVISGMVDSGIILMLIGKQHQKIFCRRLFLLTSTYSILYMFTGHRSESVITIIVLVFVYFTLINKITSKQVLIYGVVGYFLLVFIGFISDIRILGTLDANTLMEYYIKSLSSSPVYKMLGEFGTILKSVVYSVNTFPGIKEYSYGMNYIESFALVLPNINGFLNNIVNNITYIFYFKNHNAMGGSYIGEMYYAAGSFGIIFGLPIGLIVGYINNQLIVSKFKRKWIVYSICMIIFPSLLWWTRDFFYTMIREVVWTSFLVLLLNKIFRSRFNKKM